MALIAAAALFLFAGCADIKKPTLENAITHPWSTKTEPILGMTKEEIKQKWGEPDILRNIGYDEIGAPKEEWVYNSRFSKVPLDYRYIAKTKYLYFNGNSLVNMKDEEEVEKEANK